MGQRTITECDRCRREIKRVAAVLVLEAVENDGPVLNKDLCDSCSHKVERLLAGEELEVPP